MEAMVDTVTTARGRLRPSPTTVVAMEDTAMEDTATTAATPASPPPPLSTSPAMPPPLCPPSQATGPTPPLVATPLTLPELSTSPRGRLRPMPTMAATMADTATAMVDTDMEDTDITMARGRPRLMPTNTAMAMVDTDMEDTD